MKMTPDHSKPCYMSPEGVVPGDSTVERKTNRRDVESADAPVVSPEVSTAQGNARRSLNEIFELGFGKL